jgi:hypothetical protein
MYCCYYGPKIINAYVRVQLGLAGLYLFGWLVINRNYMGACGSRNVGHAGVMVA